MALIGLEATTQHFDQPVMMPEEFYKANMSFTELTLRSIQSWYEPRMYPPYGPWPVIAVDHIYHHFIPALLDSHIPKYVKDEIDQIILEEMGLEIIQRSLLTCFIETYSQYFGIVEPSRMKGYVVVTKDRKDPFKPLGMSTAEYHKRSRMSTNNHRTTYQVRLEFDVLVIVNCKCGQEQLWVVLALQCHYGLVTSDILCHGLRM